MAWEIFGIVLFQVIQVTLALAITYIAGKIVSKFLFRLFEKTPFPENVENAMVKISKYIVYVVGIFAVISLLGFDLTSIIIGLGAFSIAISFAMSTIIQNLVSGLLVQADKAFRIGDEIEIKGVKGKVVKISVRTTVVETEEGNLVFVPNSFFMSNPVTRKRSIERMP